MRKKKSRLTPGFFLLFVVKECLSVEQGFVAFDMLIVRDAAVYRANCGTLRLVVKTFTFGTFGRNDIVNVVRYRNLRRLGIDFLS